MENQINRVLWHADFLRCRKFTVNQYDQGINYENRDKWIEVVQDEMNSLHENKTWVLVDKPGDQKHKNVVDAFI